MASDSSNIGSALGSFVVGAVGALAGTGVSEKSAAF
jgi:hypothetical protein